MPHPLPWILTKRWGQSSRSERVTPNTRRARVAGVIIQQRLNSRRSKRCLRPERFVLEHLPLNCHSMGWNSLLQFFYGSTGNNAIASAAFIWLLIGFCFTKTLQTLITGFRFEYNNTKYKCCIILISIMGIIACQTVSIEHEKFTWDDSCSRIFDAR